MPRPLHADTKVQRAASADAAPPEVRERGYEAQDARARPVLFGVGGFLALMLLGLGSAALLLAHLGRQDATPRAPEPAMAVHPPPPHLLTTAADRSTPEAQPPRNLDSARRSVLSRGWDTQPAPAATDVARDHRETIR